MQTREVHMMGTVIQLSLEHEYASWILDELVIRLQEFEKRFSAHDPSSELMEVNKHAGVSPVKVHPDLYGLIKIGKEHSMAANSSLNITIGPLVQAWRIGFKDAHVPSEKTIQSLLKRTDASDIILDDREGTVFLRHTGMFIDLGALAKGYIADLLINDLQSMNVQSALLNLGGNVMAYGSSPNHEDGYWRIGIQHPFQPRGQYVVVVKALNQSVVTSGIYERKFTVNNETYHHILDPATGYPVESEIAGLTVVSKKSVDGEIWTGRLFGKPPQEIIRTLDEVEDTEGLVITKKGEIYYTESLEPSIVDSISIV